MGFSSGTECIFQYFVVFLWAVPKKNGRFFRDSETVRPWMRPLFLCAVGEVAGVTEAGNDV